MHATIVQPPDYVDAIKKYEQPSICPSPNLLLQSAAVVSELEIENAGGVGEGRTMARLFPGRPLPEGQSDGLAL